ncbi:MAG TPA: hypothetical protein VIK55_10460 [Paludibacter sp.]
MKIKKQFKYPIYFFIIYVLVSVLSDRFYGIGSKSGVSTSNPLEWNEIFQHLPHTFLTALIIGVISGWFINRANKENEKNLDDIRKKNQEDEDN